MTTNHIGRRSPVVAKIGRSLMLVSLTLILAACGGGSGSNTASSPAADAILQFQSGSEELKLASLQVGQNVYPDVTLRLAQDNTWQLKSLGAMRPLALGESAQAALTAPAGATLDMNWHPADATITINRMHIDAKVFGSVGLHLAGNNWNWVNELKELKALTLADYRANPALAATDTHHTVLQSAPGSGAQSFPLQLSAKTYKFCMDKQDEGADSITLLDPAGAAVVSLKAGDACVSIKLAAGLYTMQHVYGGTGANRTVFIRPDAAAAAQPAASTAPRKNALSAGAPRKGILAASDPKYPEYAAIHLLSDSTHGDGYLSFNGIMIDANHATDFNNQSSYITDVTAGCIGDVDAAASLQTWYRTGDPSPHYLFDSRNFFQISRDANGTPIYLLPPLLCSTTPTASLSGQQIDGILYVLPLDPSIYQPGPDNNGLNITYNAPEPNQFQLPWGTSGVTQWWGFHGNGSSSDPPYSGLVASAIFTEQDVLNQSCLAAGLGCATYSNTGTLNLFTQGRDAYEIAYRYFPNGLPPSMQDSSGSWLLNSGEAAVFANADCSGAALITNRSLPQQSGSADVQRVYNSLWLGPNTVATVTDVNSTSGTIYDQSGCQKLTNPLDFLHRSLRNVGVSTINIQTSGCPHCNLAGLDFTPFNLKGVDLSYANLDNGIFSTSATAFSDLTNAKLTNASLQGATLNYANLEGADLSGASLGPSSPIQSTSLIYAYLHNTILYGADLTGANMQYASWFGDSAKGDNAILAGTDFSYANLPGLSLKYAHMQGAIFENTVLMGADLTTDSTHSFIDTTFQKADLRGANLSGANLSGADLINAVISTASGADFIEVMANPTTYANQFIFMSQSYNATSPPADTSGVQNCPYGFRGSSGCGGLSSAYWQPTAAPSGPSNCTLKHDPTHAGADSNGNYESCTSQRHHN